MYMVIVAMERVEVEVEVVMFPLWKCPLMHHLPNPLQTVSSVDQELVNCEVDVQEVMYPEVGI